MEAWLRAYNEQQAVLDKATREPIGLPCDGATYNDATLEEFKCRLLSLREVGYHVPDHALERIDAELREQQP